jgi:putative toxin-antitoxin system antitoxin component (TIGR02293 family)
MQYSFLYEMFDMPKKTVESLKNDSQMIQLIRDGLKRQSFEHFIKVSGRSLNQWSSVLPISKRTIERNKKKLFIGETAEALIEIGEIYELGLKAFNGDRKRFDEWLDSGNPYFNSDSPMSIMDTHRGRGLVKDELLRIEHGEFA